MIKYHFILLALILMTGCAGPNPNPGERTTDVSWSSGDYVRAFQTAKPYADAGEPWAQLRMGQFYENGWGTEQNTEMAEYWYKKAAAQEATGAWETGQMIGATGRQGYFNQNSDAMIAQYNLAKLYYREGRDLDVALKLVENVIEKSQGYAVFFCCEFSGGRYFVQSQFEELKLKIEQRINE
jgi:TPR repeat protein